MARKKSHEDHTNHEAWAIPYADLMTLLLAFFVVMYAISSINEGKYRIASNSLAAAFGGTPRTITPLQLGQAQLQGALTNPPSAPESAARRITIMSSPLSDPSQVPSIAAGLRTSLPVSAQAKDRADYARAQQRLQSIGTQIEKALDKLVQKKLVIVRRGDLFLEIEINSDILFASGSATPSATAVDTVQRLAGVLRDVPNAIRIEGYTDDRPINTMMFRSNWELSAGRAASVVHVFASNGVAQDRMAVVGYGEQRPRKPNTSEAGRNANRRVVLIILAQPESDETLPPASQLAMPQPPAPDSAPSHPEAS